jgi:succinylglutamate desuccinylase
VDHVESAIWIALLAAGLIDEGIAPEIAAGRGCLHEICRDLPKIFEVRYRHAVNAESRFRMEPGFVSFQKIRAGELLAIDRHGECRAREDGRILMPLYQEQGEDGYFEIREFSPFWLRVSALMRKMRADKIVHWLPGVSRHPQLPDALSVDRRVARFFVLEIFHLLGYRRHRDAGKRLVVSRRREDPSSS